MHWLLVVIQHSQQVRHFWITLENCGLHSSPDRSNVIDILHLFLDHTLGKSPTTFLSRSRDADFVRVLVHCPCKLCRQVQVIESTIVVFLLKLVKHSQNSGMQWRIPKLCPLFWHWLIAEVKGPGESCVCQCIALETVSHHLVGDPQVVGMTSLKTNHLLVS